MRWISVESRLPEDGQVVLCFCEKIGMVLASCYHTQNYPNWVEQTTCCGCCADVIDPIYWMKLPNKPE